ncbi:MAG: hypothetical protein DSZ29_07055 [Aquificaceae bacterium]|nr:MAG: hypothetical protein DSZ29_07055 [Aquificaceae bacterium]
MELLISSDWDFQRKSILFWIAKSKKYSFRLFYKKNRMDLISKKQIEIDQKSFKPKEGATRER